MSKRKKRRLNEPDGVLDISTRAPLPDATADDLPPDVAQPGSRLEVTFRLDQVHNSTTANKTERSLLKLLERICSKYSDRYQVLNQSFVNHHLSVFSMLGMPVELSSKSSYYQYTNAIGAHSACTRFIRANQRRQGDNYHFTEILRLYAWAERASNNNLYSRFGLSVPSFTIKRNWILLFDQLLTLNSLITSRRWAELGRYLNSRPFLHTPLTFWWHSAQTVNRVTFIEKSYRSLRHDMFISALFVWQAATLRILHMEESREWASSRQLAILRRAISQCKIVCGIRVPEHILLADSVAVMLSLEEAYMIHHFHIIDLNLDKAHELYRQPYEAFKLLAQSWCWQSNLRIISGVTDPGSLLIDALLEVAEREGSAGVVFALSALRGFMKIVDVVEDQSSLDRLLGYSIACPRAVRPLAAEMREYGMEEQAREMIQKAIDPTSDIHPSDPVWVEWAEGKMKEVDVGDGQTHTAVASVLLPFLDYGSNRLHERAWILLDKALEGSDDSRWNEWWEERAEWWPEFHEEEMEKRGKKARRKVLKRFAKVDISHTD